MSNPENKLSGIGNEMGCACCNGHDDHVSNEISRRKFMQVTGTSVLGTVALSGLSWSALASIQAGKKSSIGRNPLIVKPIFTYEIPTRRDQTSWRAWGGIQTENDASKELMHIQCELKTLQSKADFPVEFLPVARVRETSDLSSITDLQSADLFLIYAAGGGMDIFDSLNKTGKNMIFFCRHKSGPVYLWYEIISPKFLRQRTDKLSVSGIDENDVPGNEVNFSKTLTDSPNDHGFDYSIITSAFSTVDPPYVFIENGKCTALSTEKMETNAPVVTFGSRPGPMAPNWSNENVDPTFVQKSEAFIEHTLKSDKKKPFFLYLALSAPHAPWLPPDFVKGKSNEGPRGDLVVLLDWCVGQISKILDERGITENTLVIFTSDNGPRIGKNGHQSAGKLKGYKSHIWEGGHRVPFIAKLPDKIAPNSSSSELICLTDILRTLGDVANADIPENAGPDKVKELTGILEKYQK